MTIELTKELISRVSVTPDDGGCQQLIAERLEKSGCMATHLRFDDVDNLWLTHGSGAPVFSFLGHTDVVPAGTIADWKTDPFEPVMKDGFLYGRGAADMKGSVAAMVTAMERFIRTNPDHPGTLALMLTSDEEGIAINGTKKVVEYLNEQNITIQWCLVGEPSSKDKVGDIIKNGRRGSLTGQLRVYGQQGHVAYPDLAENPIHRIAPALAALCGKEWDRGNEHYPPTSFQVSNIHAGDGTTNVIPGELEMSFNFRYCTESTEEQLIKEVEMVLDNLDLRYALNWLPSSKPFLTESGKLLDVIQTVVARITGYKSTPSTVGGTSDGRFIAPTGAEVVEIGPVNETIHKVNECVKVDDLETLSGIYEGVLQELLGS